MSTNYRIPVPAVAFQPPIHVCRFTDKPFSLDGNLEKEFWRNIPFTSDFVDMEGPGRPRPRFRTRVKLAWDKENLYVGALLEGDEIWAEQTVQDAVIAEDNYFGFYIDPDADTQAYFAYGTNALHADWKQLLNKTCRDKGEPVKEAEFSQVRSAVFIDGKLNQPGSNNHSWSVEVVIPFGALQDCGVKNNPPLPGEYYRINCIRSHWKVDIAGGGFKRRQDRNTGTLLPADRWVWAPTGVDDIHYPELWAFLFFSDVPKSARDFSIPEDELRKWELRQLYYAEHAYFDGNKSYTDNLDTLKGILAEISPCPANKMLRDLSYQLKADSQDFEISCPAGDGKGTLTVYGDGKTIYVANAE